MQNQPILKDLKMDYENTNTSKLKFFFVQKYYNFSFLVPSCNLLKTLISLFLFRLHYFFNP